MSNSELEIYLGSIFMFGLMGLAIGRWLLWLFTRQASSYKQEKLTYMNDFGFKLKAVFYMKLK